MIDLESRIRSWMFDIALPFWTTSGVDEEYGGYVERFDIDTLEPYTQTKRIRVIGRQIYVFSHAAHLGHAGALDAAKIGVDFLLANGWAGEDVGWASVLSRDGTVVDRTPDLYDQAFALFALGWYFKVSQDASILDHVERTLDAVEKNYRAEIGFYHVVPTVGHRQQNPHMHLLEAMLILHEASQAERYANLAREIIGLFQTHFFNVEKGTLTEFFDEQLQPANGVDGRITEPGHQFEWAWILENAQRQLGLDLTREIYSLINFAETFGVDPQTGITYQQVRDDGKPMDMGSRTWPNTERLKSAAALYYLEGKDPLPVFQQSTKVLFDRYLAAPKPGMWTEKFDSDGNAITDIVPTSTFYHVFLGFSEVLSVLDSIQKSKSNPVQM